MIKEKDSIIRINKY